MMTDVIRNLLKEIDQLSNKQARLEKQIVDVTIAIGNKNEEVRQLVNGQLSVDEVESA